MIELHLLPKGDGLETPESLQRFLKPREVKKSGPQLVALAQKLEDDETALMVTSARHFDPDMRGLAALTESRLVVTLAGGGRAVWGSYAYNETPYVRFIGEVATIGPNDLVIALNKEMCRELGRLVQLAGGIVL